MCPQEAIVEDLALEIRQWQEEGDLVIILTNFNDDIHSDDARNFFASFGLSEAITGLHGPMGPPTYNQGSYLIDGMFIPSNLIKHCQGGILHLAMVFIAITAACCWIYPSH